MEKLLNLLNEYMFVDTSVCKHLYNKDVETIYVRTTLETGEIDDERVRDEWIISKRFGFIKWLVDNDKIDIDKYYEFMTNENIDISNACGELDMDKEFYYELLMILAVQDNSIEFLISILK